MPFPHDSEAQHLQLQIMAATAEPAHRLCLLLHHCVWPPVFTTLTVLSARPTR